MATRIYRETKSRLSPKKAVNAVWYDRVTCTSESSALLIQSDIVTSMYKLLEEEESADCFAELLKALHAAKHSLLKFDRICTDETICTNSGEFKMSIVFIENKERISVTVRIHSVYDNRYLVRDDSVGIPIKFKHWKKIIKRLEEEYEKL